MRIELERVESERIDTITISHADAITLQRFLDSRSDRKIINMPVGGKWHMYDVYSERPHIGGNADPDPQQELLLLAECEGGG